jgi:hypothetical protein
MRLRLIGLSAGAVCLGTLLYPQVEPVQADQVRAVQRVQKIGIQQVQKVQQVPSRAVQQVQAAEPTEPLALLERFELEPVGGISPEVLNLALNAVNCGVARGDIAPPPTLTVIDYSKPSVEPRLWVFDMTRRKLLFNELVAHGRNTGENMSEHFSDTMNSRQSSIGLFVTDETYVGSNGYSLRLNGLEPGFNGRARDRAIVMHGAPYVNEQIAATQGRIGRSWGCPALREAVARDVINTIRGGGVIFSYYPDSNWLKSSKFLNGCDA